MNLLFAYNMQMAEKTTKSNRQPSMKDVARLAGVSRTTVSFVINSAANADSIPQETQDKVWAAVAELDYRPNAIAQGLRAQRTHTIGFLSDAIATTPYAGRIIQGAQELAWEHRNLLLLVNTGGAQELKRAAIEMMLSRQVDGLIYATMYHREVRPPDIVSRLPTVLLDCFVADRSLPSVTPDEVGGGRLATRHLLENGHRRIGFINNVDPIPATFGRLAGYKQALAEFDVPFEEALVVQAVSDSEGGYQSAMELMQRPDPPTALFCFSDRMAMGVYDALRKLNLDISGDVAVVGFDNHELIAAHLYPPLTTMELPHYAMGRLAVEHLLELIADGDDQPQAAQQLVVPCPLIVRASA